MRQAAAQAADAIRESILAGRIPAGARIAELDLARQLSVSRTPIREALSRLAAEGLVELSPNRGARVASWRTSSALTAVGKVTASFCRPSRGATSTICTYCMHA